MTDTTTDDASSTTAHVHALLDAMAARRHVHVTVDLSNGAGEVTKHKGWRTTIREIRRPATDIHAYGHLEPVIVVEDDIDEPARTPGLAISLAPHQVQLDPVSATADGSDAGYGDVTRDDRRFAIDTETVATNRDGTTRTRTGHIEIDTDRHVQPRPPLTYSVIPNIAELLWLDAYPGGPWTPSAINEVTVVRDHDTITYRRSEIHTDATGNS